jgi:hypothetical protein
MTVLPELERQLIHAAGMRTGAAPSRAARRRRRIAGWVPIALGCTVVAVVVLVFAFTGSNPRRRVPVSSGHPPATVDPTVPATYNVACAQTGDCETVRSGPVPAALRRPVRVPRLAPGGRCPTTPGSAFDNSELGHGVGLGTAPVRPDIANGGDLTQGRVVLGTTDVRGWYGIDTVWYSLPSYGGPWSVRAVRLNGTGRIDLGEEPAPLPATSRNVEKQRFSPVALVIPPGDTVNTGAGYRTDPRTTWISAPGCYGFQVDGLGFSELIVFQALPPG